MRACVLGHEDEVKQIIAKLNEATIDLNIYEFYLDIDRSEQTNRAKERDGEQIRICKK
jgi:hypothetical protein